MLSVIVPWRTDHGEREEIWAWNRDRWRMRFPGVQIIECDSGDDEFSRGRSRNLGVQDARGDIIVIADSDTIPIPAFLHRAEDLCSKGSPWVVAYDKLKYYNLNKKYTDRLLRLSPTVEVPEPLPEMADHVLTSTAGMLVMRKDLFIPYDERFVGWGWEDNAFEITMSRAHGKYDRVIGGYAVHMHHSRGNADFNSGLELQNRALFDSVYRPGWVDERLYG